MILTCPNCGTQYVVKDGAIPPQGRQVRCASCKHSWHEQPELDTATEAEAVIELGAEDEPETIAEATMIEPRSGPEAEERAYDESLVEEALEPEPVSAPDRTAAAQDAFEPARTGAADFDAPPIAEAQSDDGFSPFAERDYVEPRGRSPLLTILLVLVIVAAAAAAFWFLAPPEWKARVGLAEAGATPLTLVTTHMDRQKLASGNELLTVAGRVINPTSTSHSVPPIYAQLKSRGGKVIYSWTIAPPAPTLEPGASASFNSAEVNVPSGGDELTISLGAPRA